MTLIRAAAPMLALLLGTDGLAQEGQPEEGPDLREQAAGPETGPERREARPGGPGRIRAGPPEGARGPSLSIDANATHAFRAGIDGTEGGKVSTTLAGSRLTFRAPLTRRTGLSLSAGAGVLHYEFSGPVGIVPADQSAWETIAVSSVGAGVTYAFDRRTRAFAGVNLSSAGEDTVAFDESITVGGSLGVGYRVGDRLTVGAGLTVQTRLDDDIFILPFPTVDWMLPFDEDRWRLVVGGARIGPSRAAGVTLVYEASETVTLSGGLAGLGLGGDFRLDDTGPAPGGVGRDRSFPILLGVDWEPTPRVTLRGYAGVALFGEIELLDSNGRKLADRDIDPQPTLGVGLTVRF